MTADQIEPGRMVLLPSGNVIEVLEHNGGVAECRVRWTGEPVELRIDWLLTHGSPCTWAAPTTSQE